MQTQNIQLPPNFPKNLPLVKAFRKVRGEVECYNSALMIYCIYMQNIQGGRFCGQIRGELNIMILHFNITCNISEMQTQNIQLPPNFPKNLPPGEGFSES